MRWLSISLLLLSAGCKEKTAAEICRDACSQLTTCNDVTMLQRIDCSNGCARPSSYPECPGCLAGAHASCADIAEGRVCNSSCRSITGEP